MEACERAPSPTTSIGSNVIIRNPSPGSVVCEEDPEG
jgi:hypothetical protein